MSDQSVEHDDTTRASAHLPGLDIEVAHRRLPDAEQISIHLQAMPSFAAFGDYFDSVNPFAFWVKAAQIVWSPWLTFFPWLDVAHALPPDAAREMPPTAPE